MTSSIKDLLDQENPNPVDVVATIKEYAETGVSIGTGLPGLLVNTQLSVHQLELINNYLIHGKFVHLLEQRLHLFLESESAFFCLDFVSCFLKYGCQPV